MWCYHRPSPADVTEHEPFFFTEGGGQSADTPGTLGSVDSVQGTETQGGVDRRRVSSTCCRHPLYRTPRAPAEVQPQYWQTRFGHCREGNVVEDRGGRGVLPVPRE